MTPFDRLGSCARAASTPDGYSDEHDLLRPHFDHAFYLAAHPGIARAKLDPLAHYMRSGNAEGQNPTAWFSGATYLAGQPDAKDSDLTTFGHWIMHDESQKTVASPLSHINDAMHHFGLDPCEGWSMTRQTMADVTSRLDNGTLAQMLAKAEELEPQIKASRPAATRLRAKPFTGDRVLDRFAVLTDLQETAQHQPADTIIVTDRWHELTTGFAALGLAEAIAGKADQGLIAVLTFDGALDDVPFDIPDKVRLIDLSSINRLSAMSDQHRTLTDFARSMAPVQIIVFDTAKSRPL